MTGQFDKDGSGEKLCPTVLSPLAPSPTSGAHKSHLMRIAYESERNAPPKTDHSTPIASCACDDLQAP
ncbi:hypothetical protein KC19_7G026700 [Ceratodon purpureus]|uniref:Uncharacterized protein n=1 Tax=Ceratodon purpureus TaxID=3225 RepID=A0A8T0H5B6_CERPU|nr:hypothetical protein KC19_7G026700 [Ceratodon purpureus]